VLSKSLSYAIVAFSLLYKVPQILKCTGNKSAAGITPSSLLYEVVYYYLSPEHPINYHNSQFNLEQQPFFSLWRKCIYDGLKFYYFVSHICVWEKDAECQIICIVPISNFCGVWIALCRHSSPLNLWSSAHHQHGS
jgi:hypothetical protein